MTEQDLIYTHSLSYLVGLSMLTDYPDGISVESSPGQRRMMMSATLFEFDGAYVIATAGHIVKQLEDIVAKGHKIKLSLIDAWSKDAIDASPIPITFDPEACWHDSETEIDLGFIPIHPNTVRLLAANGVKSIDESHWSVEPDDERFDVCAALGLPVDQFQVAVSQGNARIKVSPAMVRLEHKFEVPEAVLNSAPAFWYGRVPKNQVKSYPFGLNGLSGGPVFGFSRNQSGTIQLFVIGWQFAVQKHGDSVFFCITPTNVIARILSELLKNVSDDSASDECK